jgi:hypothetical protein
VPDRRTAAIVATLVVVAVLFQIPLWRWEVEDAAITFAYADTFVRGDGLVPQAGAERVEGFSNPTWLLVLAPFLAVGIDPFVASRWVGCVLAVACVPLVWKAALPLGRTAALAAAAIVSVSATHAIWAQSGLENALFACLAAAGILRVSTAGDRDVLAPLLFFALANTRPDGVGWAAIGGLFALGGARTFRSLATRLLSWGLAFGAPMFAIEAARLAYFAQELPATFYAKVGHETLDLFAWNGRGWKQLREVATQSFPVLPFLVAGAVGFTRWRAATAAAILVVATACFLLPDRARAGAFLFFLGVVPLLSLGRPRVVSLATWLLAFGVLFQLGVQGDWMNGARFLSLVVVPGAIVAGAGLAFLPSVLPRAAWPVIALVFVVFGAAQLEVLRAYDRDPEATPGSVKARLDAWIETARKLGMVRRPHIVDHDMGGIMWWGRNTVWFRDARGLVDLPFALHGRRSEEFTRHELFGDRYPPFDFAHRHASTATVLARLGKEMRDYVEIPGYGRRVEKHKGQWIRRDLFLVDAWPHTSTPIAFAGGVTIDGVHVPSPEVGPGSGVFVEIGMRRQPRFAFRVVAFLANEHHVGVSWDLAPAYDWVLPPRWHPEEIFHGKFSLRIPEDIAEGRWDLGLVVFDQKGQVLPVLDQPAAERPVFAAGEVRLPGVVTVVSRERMDAYAEEDVAASVAAARDGRCTDAEHAWLLAVAHRPRSADWKRRNVGTVAAPIAACWSSHAAAGSRDGDALLARVIELQQGRDWDPREPAVWSNAVPIATEAHARALAAVTDAERFRWHDAAVRADPRRAWDRRWAEQARARLLDAEALDPQAP